MQKVSLWDIFWAFAGIGAFTIGGGYTMIPAIENEMRRRGWISDEELPDIVTLSQSGPGLLAVNMSIFAGYRLRGLAGSIVASLGCIIAPFAIILLIAMFFSNVRDNRIVAAIFSGVRPAAVAIIAAYMVKLVRKGRHDWWTFAITGATLFLVAFLKLSPIYILLVLIIGAVAFSLYRQKRGGPLK